VFDNMERWITYSIRKGIGNKVAQNAREAMSQHMEGQVSDKPLSDKRASHLPKAHIIAVWENGTLNKYSVEDPLFFHYFNGVQSVTLPLLNWSNKVNRFFRGSIIYDPFFTFKQVSMDAFSAMFTSGVKHWYKIPILAVKEFGLTLVNKSKLYNQLRAVGAVGERNWAAVENRLDIETAAGLRKPNLFERVVSGALKPLKWFSMVADNAIRQAVVQQTLNETKSAEYPNGDKALAINRAFELINFRRGGYNAEVTFARQNVIFLGAYLQALNVTVKVLRGRGIAPIPIKTAYARLGNVMVGVGVMSFIYAMMMGDDDEYKDADPTVRDTHIFVPGLTKKGIWLPMRSEIFTLFSKMAMEHVVNLMKKDGEDWTKFKRAFKHLLANSLLGPTPMPQAPKIAYELASNMDYNTNRPIVGPGVSGVEAEIQHSASTSQLAKDWGKALGVSPIKVDYFMSQIGSVGAISVFAYDKMMGDAIHPEKSNRDVAAKFAPGFVKKEFGARAKSDLYELKDLVDEAYNTYNELNRSSTETEVNKFLLEKGKLMDVKAQVDSYIKSLASYRAAEKSFIDRPPSNMTKEEIEAAIHNIHTEERDLLKEIGILRKQAGLDEGNPFRKTPNKTKPDWAKDL